jgi:hypothetical protein
MNVLRYSVAPAVYARSPRPWLALRWRGGRVWVWVLIGRHAWRVGR